MGESTAQESVWRELHSLYGDINTQCFKEEGNGVKEAAAIITGIPRTPFFHVYDIVPCHVDRLLLISQQSLPDWTHWLPVSILHVAWKELCRPPEYSSLGLWKVRWLSLLWLCFGDNQLPGVADWARGWVVGICYCTANLAPIPGVVLLERHNKLQVPRGEWPEWWEV